MFALSAAASRGASSRGWSMSPRLPPLLKTYKLFVKLRNKLIVATFCIIAHCATNGAVSYRDW